MKGLTKWIIIAVFLVFCIQAVSAFTVSSISIDPSGTLTPSQQVLVSFRVDFSASSGETFASGNELQLITDLNNPKWSYTLLLDEVENPRPSASGRILSMSGFELSYPSKVEESLRVTLEGTAPTVTQTTNKTIIKVQELDSHNNIITSTVVERTALVVNIDDVKRAIAEKNAALQTFRSHIDEKSALSVDTSTAEAKYSEAKQKIDAASALASGQYVQALNNLATAQTALEDGEKALDRAWAESEVANAQIPINNADVIIAWFRGNQSTANDQQLPTIITKREVALSYISTASDEISNGNYAQARAKAQEAFNKGNESYTDALARQKEVSNGINPIGLITGLFKGSTVIIVAIVIIVLIVVGVVIYRKRSRWDELG
jgi:hypothetical protein